MKKIATILTLFVISTYPSFEYQRKGAGASALKTRLSGETVANGETLLLEITRPDTVVLGHITAGLGDTTALRLYEHPVLADDGYFALVGINYYAEPYSDTIHVMWTEDDISYTRSLPFQVTRGSYPSSRVTGVPQSRVTPSSADYRRIARERKEIGAGIPC